MTEDGKQTGGGGLTRIMPGVAGRGYGGEPARFRPGPARPTA